MITQYEFDRTMPRELEKIQRELYIKTGEQRKMKQILKDMFPGVKNDQRPLD